MIDARHPGPEAVLRANRARVREAGERLRVPAERALEQRQHTLDRARKEEVDLPAREALVAAPFERAPDQRSLFRTATERGDLAGECVHEHVVGDAQPADQLSELARRRGAITL